MKMQANRTMFRMCSQRVRRQLGWLPDSTPDLFEHPLLCALSTVNPDGQPHTVPVWCDRDERNGAREHINSLSQKYTGSPIYQGYGGRSNVNRLMYLIEPDKVHGR